MLLVAAGLIFLLLRSAFWVVPLIRNRSSGPCDDARSIVVAPPAPTSQPLPVISDLQQAMISLTTGGWSLDANFHQDLAMASSNHGRSQDSDLWRRQLAAHHFTAGWTRVWVRGAPFAFGQVIQDVLAFRTPADAASFQRWVSVEYNCRFARETFSIPWLPGAVGFRIVYRADGRITDQVSFVIDNRRFLVLLGSLREPPDRAELLAILRTAVEWAAGSSVGVTPG